MARRTDKRYGVRALTTMNPDTGELRTQYAVVDTTNETVVKTTDDVWQIYNDVKVARTVNTSLNNLDRVSVSI